VASVTICKKHHFDSKKESRLIKQSKVIRHILYDDSRLRQIEIHTHALNANEQMNVISNMKHIVR
jgi:hypothetical protein